VATKLLALCSFYGIAVAMGKFSLNSLFSSIDEHYPELLQLVALFALRNFFFCSHSEGSLFAFLFEETSFYVEVYACGV
jgi:hypothetical protein